VREARRQKPTGLLTYNTDERLARNLREDNIMATDWKRLFAEIAKQNEMINEGICPLCGRRAWGEGPEEHADDCPNRRPVTGNGTGKGWRRGRGRQRHSDRARRLTEQDI